MSRYLLCSGRTVCDSGRKRINANLPPKHVGLTKNRRLCSVMGDQKARCSIAYPCEAVSVPVTVGVASVWLIVIPVVEPMWDAMSLLLVLVPAVNEGVTLMNVEMGSVDVVDPVSGDDVILALVLGVGLFV